MKKRLELELKALAEKILKLDTNEDIAVLQYEARKLYENITVLKFIEDKLNDLEIDVNKSEIAEKFKELATAVLAYNAKVPESNPHEEDIITPGIETIKDMVAEMPQPEEIDDFLAEITSQPTFEKKEKEILATPVTKEPKTVTLNDKLKKGISIGLNDKLAFIKHLFNDSTEDYNRVISQLNTKTSFEEAKVFIEQMVKPDYNNWDGKEAYETRFLELIEARFI